MTLLFVVLCSLVASAQDVTVPGSEPLPPLAPLALDLYEIGGADPLEIAEIERSLPNHPTLAAQRARVAAAEGARVSADGAFDLSAALFGQAMANGYYDWWRAGATLTQPTTLYGATLSAGYRVGGGDFQSYYDYETLDAGEVRAQIRVPLLRDGAIDPARAGIRRAEIGIPIARAEVDEQALRLRRDAALAHVRWVAAGLKYRVARHLLDLAENRDAQIAGHVRAGALPAIEQIENRRAILMRRRDLIDAHRALESAGIALSLFHRDRRGEPIVPAPERCPTRFAPPTLDLAEVQRLGTRALELRPEVSRAELTIGRADVAVELADNQVLPRLDVSIAVSQDLGEGTVDRRAALGDPVLEGMLVLSVPLQQREARGRRATAEAEVEEARERARLVGDQVRAEVRDAVSALNAAAERIDVARDTAEVAEQVAAAERARFELGATTLLVVNLRETASADAESAHIDALAALLAAEAHWKAAAGVR